MTSAASIADASARACCGFVERATPLADIDFTRIGHIIGVGENEIHAVIDVDASGGGFDNLKWPKMLCEPRVFYHNLTSAERTHAVSPSLAYAGWKPGTYPSDSNPGLSAAMATNETAALKAASWGARADPSVRASWRRATRARRRWCLPSLRGRERAPSGLS